MSAVTFFMWLQAIASGIYFYVARADIVRDEILILSAASTAIAGTVYFVMGCIRGFTLIPVTYLIPFGLLFLSPAVHFLLTIGGILVSSAGSTIFRSACSSPNTSRPGMRIMSPAYAGSCADRSCQS